MSGERTGLDPYAIVLTDLYRRRSEIDAAIHAIETLNGTAKAMPLTDPPKTAPGSDFQSGNFLGLSIAEASKKLLSGRRKTLNSAEIAEGLSAAGYPMSAAEPGNVVGSVLSRRFETIGDVVRVSRGQWGLPEWYPNRSFRKRERENSGKKAEPYPTPETAMETLSALPSKGSQQIPKR